MINNLKSVVEAILAARTLDDFSIHGPKHWARVDGNARYCASLSGGDLEVARLFALFHDSQRWNDGADPEHGRRGAELAVSMNGQHFHLDNEQLDKLVYACEHHTFGMLSDDPTIGSCWDGDRLDLTRVGAIPDPKFMSTDAGRGLAKSGDMRPVAPFMQLDL